MRLLIVDDEPLIARGVKVVTLKLGTAFDEVDTALSGKEALDQMRDKHYDLVITDVNMPEMTGLDLIRAALKEKLCSRFCVLSGYSEFEYAQSAVRLGVSAYLLKPVDKEELRRTLNDCEQQIVKDRERERRDADSRVRALLFGAAEDVGSSFAQKKVALLVAVGCETDALRDALVEIAEKRVMCFPIPLYHAPAVVILEDPERKESLIRSVLECAEEITVGIAEGVPAERGGLRALFVEGSQAALFGVCFLDRRRVDAKEFRPFPNENSASFAMKLQKRLGAAPEGDRVMQYRIRLQSLICGSGEEKAGASPYVQQMKSIARQRFRENIGLQEIAATVGLNPDYMGRIFRTEEGVSFSEYLNRLRITQVLQIMERDPNLSFDDLAPLMGFSDTRSFFRVFKRIMHITPGEYRRRVLHAGLTSPEDMISP